MGVSNRHTHKRSCQPKLWGDYLISKLAQCNLAWKDLRGLRVRTKGERERESGMIEALKSVSSHQHLCIRMDYCPCSQTIVTVNHIPAC